MVRAAAFVILGFLAWAPAASAHGALTLNEFDTYAISDFEGHEDSFVWEGFEIWDVYAGDGYSQAQSSHGVYFKVNLAGDGTLRPANGRSWDLRFTFTVGGEPFERWIKHDGTDVTTDFEELEWQIADGNVFQIHAWAPVAAWEGQGITDLVVESSVDGAARDIAPGGIFDPATGTEVPVHVPATPVFPEIGQGRIVEAVPLTGAAKFVDVAVTPTGDGAFDFTVTNPLSEQGQHVLFHHSMTPGWMVDGMPDAESLAGAGSMPFTLQLATDPTAAVIEPLRLDFLTDIGGLRSYYAFVGEDGIQVVDDPAMAMAATGEVEKEAPALPLVAVLGVLLAARRLRRVVPGEPEHA